MLERLSYLLVPFDYTLYVNFKRCCKRHFIAKKMSTPEKDGLLLNNSNHLETHQQRADFPMILVTQHSMGSQKSDLFRRNTPLPSSKYRKPDARLMTKRGKVRVYFKRIPQKSLQYAKDLWNTLVDMQWRWLILTVAIVNVLAYITCGMLFYFDSWISGDFDNDTDYPCMVGVQNMRDFFMLGIETITTTGYGYVHPTESCKLYFVVLTFSTLTSILIDGAFISVVYAKLNRPKDRNVYGHILSKKAVIALRNGRLCLIVRVNDRDGRHWINSDVNMYLIKDVTTQEGEVILNHMVELDTEPFGMLFWPVEVVHTIGPGSPLWDVCAKELMTTRLEILVVVSGSSVKTGQSTRSQTSYLNKEILWGYHFSPCLDYDAGKMGHLVDKKRFQCTVVQEVPLCSARTLRELQQLIKSQQRQSLNLNRIWFKPNVLFFNEV